MKIRNRLMKICVSFLVVLSILLSFVACDNSSKLEYSVNEDGTTCTVTGIGNYKGEDLVIAEKIDGYTVVAIADNAFMNCDFKTVSMPESITQIGKGAFEGCSLLENINIPKKVTVIEERTFYECTNLKTISFPYGLTDIKRYAFWYCENLDNIAFPYTLTNIYTGAFHNCISLSDIALHEGLKTIGQFAFGFCHALTEVYIPASVETLNLAFANCAYLENINVNSDNKYYTSIDGVLYNYSMTILLQYPGGKPEVSFTIPNYVKAIDTWAISGNYHLQIIDIPLSIKLIAKQFLVNCPYVNTINYTGTVLKWNAVEKRDEWDSFWQDYDYDYTIHCTDGTIAKDGTVTYK